MDPNGNPWWIGVALVVLRSLRGFRCAPLHIQSSVCPVSGSARDYLVTRWWFGGSAPAPLDNPWVPDPLELTPKTFELGPTPVEFVRIEKSALHPNH